MVTASPADLIGDFFDAMGTLSIKDLGKVLKFLGMRVELSDEHGYTVDQQAAIMELLQQIGLADAKVVRSPVRDKTFKKKFYQKLYQLLDGSLLWVSRRTRTHLSFTVHRATQPTQPTYQPTMSDWKLAKKYRWPKEACQDGKLERSQFVADKCDQKSVMGGVITLDVAVIRWMCKKQRGVSISTMEAEFTSALILGREHLGLQELVKEIGFPVTERMVMKMDNQVALRQLESEDSMNSAKHVDIRV
uniref:Pol polyprotein putative n=1 Tax=Albugo laibachii Nc14 TaxID=890382 RepID=F0W7T4_9STRA|nr:pol polyprotein putative [Albugo laibachii Nc14]|eukprot:CCA17186.1 pol polyprotein putative [Albugo laibachii Nc14]